MLIESCDFSMGSLGGILLWVVYTVPVRSLLSRTVIETTECLQRNKQKYLLHFHKETSFVLMWTRPIRTRPKTYTVHILGTRKLLKQKIMTWKSCVNHTITSFSPTAVYTYIYKYTYLFTYMLCDHIEYIYISQIFILYCKNILMG